MDLSQAHLHLMLNHIPVVGTGVVLLVALAGLFRRSRDILVTAMALGALVAVSGPIVKETGEGAEEQVEEAPWFNHDLLEEHEERADKATVVLLLAGVTGAVGVFLARGGREVKPVVAYAYTAFLAAAVALMAWTALAGGAIRHDELSAGDSAAAPAGGGEHERDRD